MTTKTKLIGSFISFTFFICSCGSTDNEQEKLNQAIIDSTKKATENEIAKKIQDEKTAKENYEKKVLAEQTRKYDKSLLNSFISDLEAELEIQYTKYEDLKSPKFLRTPSEKEVQLRQQLYTIKELEQKLSNAREQLSLLEKGKKYDMAVEFAGVVDSTTY